jgi:hypothetical protein
MPMFHPKGGDHSNMVKCPAKSPETCRLNKYGNAIHVEASSREEANERVARSMGLSEVNALGGVSYSVSTSSAKEPEVPSSSAISSDNNDELLSTLESRLDALRSSGELHADINVGDGVSAESLAATAGLAGYNVEPGDDDRSLRVYRTGEYPSGTSDYDVQESHRTYSQPTLSKDNWDEIARAFEADRLMGTDFADEHAGATLVNIASDDPDWVYNGMHSFSSSVGAQEGEIESLVANDSSYGDGAGIPGAEYVFDNSDGGRWNIPPRAKVSQVVDEYGSTKDLTFDYDGKTETPWRQRVRDLYAYSQNYQNPDLNYRREMTFNEGASGMLEALSRGDAKMFHEHAEWTRKRLDNGGW